MVQGNTFMTTVHNGQSPGSADESDLVAAARLSLPVPVVTLACSACQLVYRPDLAVFSTGDTGCPRCGGWTWVASLVEATVGGDR
ncbi:MAG TPA: hypothetical protein VGL88_11725 [Pseudonocardiaceae bacterium]|jgi:hypothetical protein